MWRNDIKVWEEKKSKVESRIRQLENLRLRTARLPNKRTFKQRRSQKRLHSLIEQEDRKLEKAYEELIGINNAITSLEKEGKGARKKVVGVGMLMTLILFASFLALFSNIDTSSLLPEIGADNFFSYLKEGDPITGAASGDEIVSGSACSMDAACCGGWSNFGSCFTDSSCSTPCACQRNMGCNEACGGDGWSNDGGATCFTDGSCGSECGGGGDPDCGLVTESTTLTAAVTNAATCFTIGANGLTLDCDGFQITFNTGGNNNQYGINVSGYNYTTLIDCPIIEGSGGGNGAAAVFFQDSINNSVTGFNVTMRTAGSALQIQASIPTIPLVNHTISKSNFTGSGNGNILVSMAGTGLANTTTKWNNINATGTQATAVSVNDAKTNLFEANQLWSDGIVIQLTNSTSVQVQDNVFLNNNLTSFGGDNSYLIDDQTPPDQNNTLKYNNSKGEIFWVNDTFQGNLTLNASYTGQGGELNALIFGGSGNVFIDNNLAAVNSSNFDVGGQYINDTANITFYSLGFDAITEIFKDPLFINSNDSVSTSTDCIADGTCVNTSYSGNTLLFNTTTFSSYTANGSSPAAGVDCGVITEDTTLTAAVTNANTCFTVGANDLTLDCAGYQITFNTGSGNTQYGINITNYNGTTLKDCLVVEGSSSGNGAVAVNIVASSNNSITGFNVTTRTGSATGITIKGGGGGVGPANNNTVSVSNITATSGGTPILLSGTDVENSTIKWNLLNSSQGAGLNIDRANDNLIEANRIYGAGAGVILSQQAGTNPKRNMLLNNNITNTNNNPVNYIIDDQTQGSAPNYLKYNNSKGEIFWVNTSFWDNLTINGTSANYGRSITFAGDGNVFIDNNLAAVNTSNFDINFGRKYINDTANITFYSLGYTAITEIFKDPLFISSNDSVSTSTDCIADGTCVNTSYSGNTLLFNTTTFSSYTANGSVAAAAADCGLVTEDTTLTAAVTNANTCFTIGANGITLDCDGYQITFATGAGTMGQYGINVSGYNYTTILDCPIVEGGITGTGNAGIYIASSLNNSVTGVNVTVLATSGVGVQYANGQDPTPNVNNTLSKSNITVTGAGATGVQLNGPTVANNTIKWNFVNTSGTSQGVGVQLMDGSTNLIEANEISGDGSAIVLTNQTAATPQGNVILNNNMTTLGSNDAIYLIEDTTPPEYNNTLKYNNSLGEIFWVNETFRGNLTFNASYTGADINAMIFGGDGNVFIDSNLVAVNSSNFQGWYINDTANLTMYSLGWDSGINISKDPLFITTNSSVSTATNCNATGTCVVTSYTGNTLLFNTSSFSSFAANGSNTPAAADCGLVTEDTTLTQAVTNGQTCFTIAANDVTLDCAGYQITFATDSSTMGQYGINVSYYNRTTLKDCLIIESTTDGTGNAGVYFLGASNNSINGFNVTVRSTGAGGIQYSNAEDTSSMINNTISHSNITVTSSSGVGVQFNGPTVANNTIKWNNINITGTSGAGVQILDGSTNTIEANEIVVDGNVIVLTNQTAATPQGNVILNNNMTTLNTNDGIYLIDDTTPPGLNNTLKYNNSFGEIFWVNETFRGNLTFNASYTGADINAMIFGGDGNVFIDSNLVAVNSSNFQGWYINDTANITLYGLSLPTISHISKDPIFRTTNSSVAGTDCVTDGSCLNNSYAGGTLLFNTSSFSSFSAGTSCSTLTRNTVLEKDISSGTTCLTIGDHNITVDCQDSSIVFATDGSSTVHGIDNTGGYDNITIKNCKIVDGSNTGTGQRGIFFQYAENGTIFNNTINVTDGVGIEIADGTNGTNISTNDVIGIDAYGIFVYTGSSNNFVDENIVNATGAYSVIVHSGTHNNVVRHNTVRGLGTSTYGLTALGSSTANNYTMRHNTVQTNGSNAALYVNDVNISVFENNSLWAQKEGTHGIYITTGTNETIFRNNNITGNSSFEIYDDTGDATINHLVYNNSFGEIIWVNYTDGGFLKNLTINLSNDQGLALGSNIQFSNNSASLNTSAFDPLKINTSANITLLGLPGGSVNHVQKLAGFPSNDSDIRFNGSSCVTDGSCEIVSYTSNTLNFNTTSFSGFSGNAPPTVDSLHLNTTNITSNQTNQNLTLYNSTSDADGDEIKVIYNWYVNDTSVTILNAPFERKNGTDSNNDRDYSSNGLTITESGSVLWNSTGGYDGWGAYQAASDGHLAATMPELKNFSYAFWWKSNGAVESGSVRLISSTNLNYQVLINTAGNSLKHGYKNSTGTQTFGSAFTCAIGAWCHAAAAFNDTHLATYFNGSLFELISVPQGGFRYEADGHTLTILADRENSISQANGTIDEVLIFNRSISAEQVQAIYNNQTNIFLSDETLRGETWNVSATPNDGIEDGDTVFSNGTTINSLPTIPVLIDPADSNNTQNRTPALTWNTSTDAESAPNITYNLVVDDNSAFNNPEINVSGIINTTLDNTTYVLETELDVDTTFFWKVYAEDQIELGENSSIRNFTVDSYLAFTLYDSAVAFGNLSRGQNVSTPDDQPGMRGENDGNVVANVTITGAAYFSSVSFPSENFQVKIAENESNSFTVASSNTSWINVSGTSDAPQVFGLNWQNDQDDFLAYINISVPYDEPPGYKNTSLIFLVEG